MWSTIHCPFPVLPLQAHPFHEGSPVGGGTLFTRALLDVVDGGTLFTRALCALSGLRLQPQLRFFSSLLLWTGSASEAFSSCLAYLALLTQPLPAGLPLLFLVIPFYQGYGTNKLPKPASATHMFLARLPKEGVRSLDLKNGCRDTCSNMN